MNREFIVTAFRIWDGVSRCPLEHGFVRVTDGMITAVGRRAELGDQDCIDLGDATLLPGLVNAHTHLTFNATPTLLADYLREQQSGLATLRDRATENLRSALCAGVTTIRDCGTVNEIVFPLRDAVAQGELPGPRIVASGRGITTAGGHCYYVGVEADSADEVAAAVRSQVAAGADFIKIFLTGGGLTPGSDASSAQYSEAELAAAIGEAARLDRRVAAHAHGLAGIRTAVRCGVDTIEHCTFQTPKGFQYDDVVVAEMAARGIVVVPTLTASLLRLRARPELAELAPPAVRKMMEARPLIGEHLRRMRDRGVTLVSGSDSGIPFTPFDTFPLDVAAMADGVVGAGMTPREALISATSAAATACGLPDVGVLAAGRRADLLGVTGNPLADIGDLARTCFVATAGRVVAPAHVPTSS